VTAATQLFKTKAIGFLLGTLIATSAVSAAPLCKDIFSGKGDAYLKAQELKGKADGQVHGGVAVPTVEKSYGSDRPIMRAWEKEGLYYSEIAEWFPVLRPEAKAKLLARLELEKTFAKDKRSLTRWLSNLKLEESAIDDKPLVWGWMGAKKRLDYLLSLQNPFVAISVKDLEFLFDSSILTFDEVKAGSKAPPKVTVGDDGGSYEVRSTEAIADRAEFIRSRAEVEKYLEGKVGHQHLFHGWPKDPKKREQMAPYYIELLDSTTWYLFWRQMNRDPKEIDSILTHPYLGVYTRDSLKRLHAAVVTNRTNRNNDKYRMVGARYFKSREEVQDPADKYLTDWELRSGNKGAKREFVETMVEARLITGDYTGIRDFQSYDFNPSAGIEVLAGKMLNPAEIDLVKRFEASHPAMKYSASKIAKNHVRNRIISPLLPWHQRLDISYMMAQYTAAQKEYAKELVAVAGKYEKDLASAKSDEEAIQEAKDKAVERLEKAIFRFSQSVRLDLALENYLLLRPAQVPSIEIQSPGTFNVNEWPLGIEYSFRFASNLVPRTKKQASDLIGNFAGVFGTAMGYGTPEAKGTESHGHGVSVKFGVKDSEGDSWRFEWDGIQRTYKDGKIEEAWGGHAEVVTPKFVPREVEDQIAPLYQMARQVGMHSSRSAGGAHVNFDLNLLMAKLPAQKGARAVLNLISLFESNQELILFMWQHPNRAHAASPVALRADFAEKAAKFKGGWTELGRFLYENRYFNTFVTRKPKYVPLNLTALMSGIVPKEYIDRTLDIRNPTQEWFPNFARVTGRGEARFFDAPTDEYMAALQIKYFRALMNRAFNSETPIALSKRHSTADYERWKKDPQAWIKEASQHLTELGLEPNEFMPLLWESLRIRLQHPIRERQYDEFKDFLPSEAAKKSAG